MKDLVEKTKIPDIDYFPAIFAFEEHEVQSICITCIHSNNCVYKGDGNKTIVSCDEFRSAEGNPVLKTDNQRQYPVKEPEYYKGLCANCDHRSYCQYAHTETGIWYCEEYK